MGSLECDAWVAYYRREWFRLLRAAILLTRYTFALPWPSDTLGGVACAARDPAAGAVPAGDTPSRRVVRPGVRGPARGRMVARAPPHQRDGAGADERPLVEALAALYSYVYYGPDRDGCFHDERPSPRASAKATRESYRSRALAAKLKGVAFGSRSACGSAASARRSRDGRGSAVSRPSTGARSATGPAAAHRGEAVIASWSPRALEDSRHRQRDARLGGKTGRASCREPDRA